MKKATISIRSISENKELIKRELKTDELGEGRFEFEPPEEGFYVAEVALKMVRK